MDVFGNTIQIGRNHLHRRGLALTLRSRRWCVITLAGFARLHHAAQGLDRLARERHTTHHHFQAVVVRRVMAAGHRYRRATAQVMRSKVGDRRCHHAKVDGVDATSTQAATQCLGQRGSGQATIPTNGEGLVALRQCHRAQRTSDGLDRRLGQGLAHDAANIVGLENFR